MFLVMVVAGLVVMALNDPASTTTGTVVEKRHIPETAVASPTHHQRDPWALDIDSGGDLNEGGSAAVKVLRIAASLRAGVPVDLRENLSGLGGANARDVADVIAHTLDTGR